MPFNVPTVTTSDISFGPAVVYLGAAGATPSVDVGAITEDGVSVEITSEKRYIAQGNPRINYYNFTQAQSVMVGFTSIEWDFENFVKALGAGVTTGSGASPDTFSFGGDPLVDEVAIHVQHYMASSGNTLNVYVWKATSEQGLTMPFGQDEHQFEFKFTALASNTEWNGGATAASTRLIKLSREA
tara:strand:+ start:25257 stop:25811 length:555 start_codon:yes stop_codon:yes gene_type:complete